MRQVFISYSSRDYAQAQAVRHVLEQNDITCWMAPEDIPGGSNYTKEIPVAIRECQAFVLMLSNNAQESRWVLRELDSAVNEGKIILPFQLEDVPLNDEFNFLLTGAQRYDAYQRKTEALRLLVARIKAIIDTTAPAQPQTEPEPEDNKPPEASKKKVEIPVFQMPKKEEPKQEFGSGVCPACGSMDVTAFPDQVKPREPKEHIISVCVAAVLCLAAVFLGMILIAVMIEIVYYTEIDLDVIDIIYGLTPLLLLILAVFGGRFGLHLAGTWIHRQRIRRHIKITQCRCNTCQKKFQAVEEL